MRRTFILAILAALAAPAPAAQEVYGLGGAAAPWLKIPSSARSLGMGEAGVALAEGVDLAGLNPSALADMDGHQLSLMHNAWVGGTAIEHGAYALGLGSGLGLGLTFSYLGFGTVEKYGYDLSGNLVSAGSVSPYGYVGGLVLGHQLDQLSWGLAAKYLGQSLATTSSSTFSADLGAKLGLGGGLALGASVKDVGGQLDGSSLASVLKLGAAWSTDAMAGEGNQVGLALDLNGPLAEFSATSVNVGGEFWYHRLAALRLGYRVARSGEGGLRGLSAGFGLRYQTLELDYAYSSFGDLGAANQVSLLARFGGQTGLKAMSKESTDSAPGFRSLDSAPQKPAAKPASKKPAKKR